MDSCHHNPAFRYSSSFAKYGTQFSHVCIETSMSTGRQPLVVESPSEASLALSKYGVTRTQTTTHQTQSRLRAELQKTMIQNIELHADVTRFCQSTTCTRGGNLRYFKLKKLYDKDRMKEESSKNGCMTRVSKTNVQHTR